MGPIGDHIIETNDHDTKKIETKEIQVSSYPGPSMRPYGIESTTRAGISRSLEKSFSQITRGHHRHKTKL